MSINTGCYWHKDSQVDQRNRKATERKDTYFYMVDSRSRHQVKSVVTGKFLFVVVVLLCF